MVNNVESERISRLPPYMFARINENKVNAMQRGMDVIDLGMGNPDRPPSKHIIDKLAHAAYDKKAHGYSASRGIPHLRQAICLWYEKRFGVKLDYEKEAIVTIGSKEGISHLSLAILDRGDAVMVQNPTYPAYLYSIAIAGGDMVGLPVTRENDYIPDLEKCTCGMYPKPKVIIISYPHNPTTQVVELEFFEKLVHFAKKENIIVVHDLAYSEICFDGYSAPSFLQVKGAKSVGIEFYSMSKTYCMAGWRVGFVVGNRHIINALAKIKGYYDYGIFTPIQEASITALESSQDYVRETAEIYRKRRDVLVKGLNRIGWEVLSPKATMYVWAQIPEKYKNMKSLKFASFLLEKAGVAVSPGIGFGSLGEGYVRFALVENEHRLRQAIKGIKKVL